MVKTETIVQKECIATFFVQQPKCWTQVSTAFRNRLRLELQSSHFRPSFWAVMLNEWSQSILLLLPTTVKCSWYRCTILCWLLVLVVHRCVIQIRNACLDVCLMQCLVRTLTHNFWNVLACWTLYNHYAGRFFTPQIWGIAYDNMNDPLSVCVPCVLCCFA